MLQMRKLFRFNRRIARTNGPVGGHFIFLNVGSDLKPPATANLTDAERLELQRTASWGSGTYRIEGGKLINRYDTSGIKSGRAPNVR